MHPRIAELDEYLGQQRAQLTADVAQIAASRQRVSPGADQWSIVNVLEHVAKSERLIGERLTGWIADARAKGLARETDTTPILPTIDTDRFVDRSRHVKTSAALEPSGNLSVEEAMRAIAESRTAFRQVMAEGDGYALTQVLQPHPVFGPLHLYAWMAFVGGHMTRHAMQIREIGTTLAAGGR